jgi:uncharacterized protein YciI
MIQCPVNPVPNLNSMYNHYHMTILSNRNLNQNLEEHHDILQNFHDLNKLLHIGPETSVQ